MSQAPAMTSRPNIPIPAGRGGGFGSTRIERAQDPGKIVRRLLAYLLRYRLSLLGLLLVLAITTALDLASPFVLGLAIDNIGDAKKMLAACLALLVLYLLTCAGQFIQSAMMASVSQKALRSLRQDLFDHLQSLPLGFFDSHTHGDLMSRLTNDIDAINRLMAQNITQLLASVLTVIIIMVAIFSINFWMALCTMLVFPILLLTTGQVARRSRRNFRDLQMQLGQMNGMIEETVTGERVVQAFCREQTIIRSFDVVNTMVKDTGIRAQFLSLLVPPLITCLMNLDIALLAGLGGILATKGLISVGMIATFIAYSRRIANPFRQIGDLYNSIQAALAGGERVFNVIDEPPETGLANGAGAHVVIDGDVEFDHVSFSYTRGVLVLSDVSFHTKPGQTIALVGPTGAGKTTIINLLSRFYDVESGVIRIDGKPVQEIPRETLRREVSVVLQDTFLFSGTVMDNIRYGRLDASDEDCIDAARLANADQFIRRLPEQYETELSERASNLSQGQRQLLAIARAILADPRILILDEATSNVDTRTEVRIQQAMLRLMEGRTSFVIAHRLSTIRNADNILVIDQGRIVEAGTHVELLERKGFYYRLYTSQFKGLPVE
jgi:ATP-binding cassette, subfamily B, multidrug efflux pump